MKCGCAWKFLLPFLRNQYYLIESLIIHMSDQESEEILNSVLVHDQKNEKNKVFKFQNGSIHYCNIEQTIENQINDSSLAVHNYLCYQEQNKLIKITQILLEGRVLRIKDELEIISQVNQGEQEQKRRLGAFSRRNNYTDPNKEEKSDTKNLIKNIINIFGNWLKIRNTEATEKAGKKLKQVLKKMKYFNKMLIQELCKDRDICNCFIQFSQTDSEIEIYNSRIKDKSCHFKAMKNYTKLFQESRSKFDKQVLSTQQSSFQI